MHAGRWWPLWLATSVFVLCGWCAGAREWPELVPMFEAGMGLTVQPACTGLLGWRCLHFVLASRLAGVLVMAVPGVSSVPAVRV